MQIKTTDVAVIAVGLAMVIYAILGLARLEQADAYTLGAADGSPEAAPLAAQLGARTYRVVMDSTRPLDSYAARIDAFRAQGMRPQLVVDGVGTPTRGRTGKNWQTINYAIHAFRRWPDAFSVSVMNEPDLAGLSVCQYADTYRRAYKMLKAAGVPRVLFGEFSPADGHPLRWTDRVLACLKDDVIADGWAWHCYDSMASYQGIGDTAVIRRHLSQLRDRLHTARGNALPMYCTEYGVLTSGTSSRSEHDAGSMWANALAKARKYRVAQIVAWQIAPDGSRWDTSLTREDGSHRPAFAAIASAR